jgi:hypothetical protein
MRNLYITISLLIAFLSGCGSDSPVDPGGNQSTAYTKIITAESGGNKFEIWSSSGSSLIYGYNNIGFKVFQNGTEKTGGYVKYKPTMYHGIAGPSHSIPVKEYFYYDAGDKLFKGYATFIMYDETAFWAADYNYNNEIFVDSSVFQLAYSSLGQVLVWDNIHTQRTYVVSLISPLSPRVGLNDVNLMLHETIDLQSYKELDSAEMFIRPWMETMGHGSSNNVDPVFLGGGSYKGTANFNMAGQWFLYDSISYKGTVLTKTPPPKLNFNVY